MKSFAVISVLVFALVGCAMQGVTSQMYQPPGAAAPWRIAGTMSGTGNIRITINGKFVVDKTPPTFSKSAEATATYEGRTIILTVSNVEKGLSAGVRADVLVDNAPAAVLTFSLF